MLIACMTVMLNQNVDRLTRKQILQNLKEMKQEINEQDDDDHVFQLLQNQWFSCKQVLQIYSSETNSLYKLLNNILRACNCQLKYFTFNHFQRSVSDRKKTRSIKRNSSILLLFSRREYLRSMVFSENVGDFIQNLSFMSTSLEENVAKSFVRNCFIQINVETDPTKEMKGNRFVNISKYFSESQILFNPLNYFKVVEVIISEMGQSLQKIEIGYYIKR